MDMSFAVQALCARHLAKAPAKNDGAKTGTSKVIQVPEEIDNEVARRKLNFEGYRIDTLTGAQKDYLSNWIVQ
jgi:adenosylhomocysteinase